MHHQTYTAMWIHYIWTTKYREPIIGNDVRYKLYDYIRKVAIENDIYLDFINGIEDHVHCLISLKTTQRVCDIAKILKGNSSFWINDNNLIKGGFDWQDGYAVVSVSPSNVQRVRNYIKNQEIHHKDQTVDTELKQLKVRATVSVIDK